MILLIEIILITSIWCLGVKIITADGMALWKLGDWAGKKAENGHRIFEPLLVCAFCMPSLHSAMGYLFAYKIGIIYHFEWGHLWMYPLVVCGASVLTGVSWIIIELLIKKINYGN